ncbi:MAG TPA: DUF512 domain-containing protein [Clostridia bacterium]
MNFATMDYIIKTVYATNILPVISNCNTSCIFCSHRQNPEGIEVFKMPDLSIPDFSQIIEFLSQDSKIIIGESATRIIEGEPLLYRNIVPLLWLVRKKYPKTQIQLTTNGIMLNDEIITELTDLGGIELGISVNCLDPVKREAILGSAQKRDIRDTIMLLKDRIPFSLSSVYVPDIMDSSDIYELVSFSSQSGAMMLKIYLPGVTSISGILYPLDSTYREVECFVEDALKNYELPVVLEPSLISDLGSNVVGVIKNTPAFLAGIRRKDQVLSVNDRNVRSRVEAFSASYRAANPELTILRHGNVKKVRLQKRRNTSPGFVMHYDIDPEITHWIENIAAVNKSRKVLFVTSILAYDLLKALFETSGFSFEYQIIKAQNSFFGGNISCAGLLTAEDIIKASRDYLSHNEAPDIIILPPIMFDSRRRDLLGRSIEDISMELGIPVETSS